MNNLTILDGSKCPPGWTLVFDTCYMYVGAPMTFHEAKDFCRSDNASLPFVRDDTAELMIYLQHQMQHLRLVFNFLHLLLLIIQSIHILSILDTLSTSGSKTMTFSTDAQHSYTDQLSTRSATKEMHLFVKLTPKSSLIHSTSQLILLQ